MTDWDNPDTDALFDVILSLSSKTDARKFLRDLLTEQELIEFGKRWKAARMLHEHLPYTEIQKVTGLSSTTVARISNWIQNGEGGYRKKLREFSKN